MPQQGSGAGGGRMSLKELVNQWKRLDRRIKNLGKGASPSDVVTGKGLTLRQLKERRREYAERVINRVGNDPDKYERAGELGFNTALLGPEPGQDTGDITKGAKPSGGGGGGQAQAGNTGGGGGGGGGGAGKGGGGKGGGGVGKQARDNRLLGDKGKHYDLVRGPKGSYVVRYKFKIKGETVTIGMRIKEKDLGKYGFKPGDAKNLTKQQMKRVKNIGWADELTPHMRRGDGHVIKSLVRSLARQYGGQPILDNDEVMSVIIANSLFGWTPGEFDNQLRQTKWYKRTNEYQRNWATLVSPKQKKDLIKSTFEKVVNHLEDVYGFGWTRHVEGGMKKARQWAEKIASGQFGEPSMGFETWADRMFDKAADIEGTNAWISNESEREEKRKWLNRPEEMFEKVRSEALAWLGYDQKNTPRLDRGTLQGWANDLVSGKASEGDWANFLRQQMKRLYPYFDHNVSFQEQASPYRSIAERLLGDTVDWSDSLLRDFSKVDEKGRSTGEALSLHDFELKVRSDESRWKPGSAMFDEGLNIVRALENTFLGVG